MLKVTLIKSVTGSTKRQLGTIRALGLNKVGSSAVHADSVCVGGMIRKMGHVLQVEHLADPVEVKE